MAKRRRGRDKVATLRLGILAGAAALVLAVAGFGLYHALGVGTVHDIIAIDKPDGTGDVPVVSFFSYGCPHCRQFEGALEDWVEKLPAGVVFSRSHVSWSAADQRMARAYLALELSGAVEDNHQRIFRAIHDRSRVFASPEQIADFVDGRGVSRAAFLRAFHSERVARRLQETTARLVEFGVTGVPTLVIDDKYVVSARSRREALEAAGALIDDLVGRRGGAAAGQ